MYDLAIIGGGPAGYVAAERASTKGLAVVLFEKEALGGVCLNEGCIPTKTLLYSAKIYESCLGAAKYGVTAGETGFDFHKIMDRKNRIVRRLVAGVGAKMKTHNVTVIKSAATITGRSGDQINIEAAGETHAARKLLICTGSEAFVPPIPGIADAGATVLTSREILAARDRPASLVVIGGGVIGMEFAGFFSTLGTEVTVIEMMPEILGGLDTEISAMLREHYTRKGVKFNLGCRVTAVDGNTVEFTDNGGETHRVTVERILVSVGRKAVTAGFGLENLGVQTGPKGIIVDENMRTNIPGVYAAGDVTGFSMLAHTASREAEVVVNNLTGDPDRMKYDAVPGVVYTNPEVAGTGHTLDSAVAAGIDARELRLPMAYAGRFVVENESVNGLCKVIVENAGNRVIGVHMIGNPCSEMIFGACTAIERGMTVGELERVIFPHPTVSEIIRETLFSH